MEDLEKRRREIKNKILKKSKRYTNAYLAVLLVVFILSIALANFGSGGNQNNTANTNVKVTPTPTVTVSEKLESNTNKVKREETKVIIPCIKINEKDYVKIKIIDDNQSEFWSNLWPTSLQFDDDPKNKVSGKNSLKVTFLRKRPNPVFGQKIYSDYQDWSNAKYFGFWFKGNNTGEIFDIYVYFNKKWSDYIVFRFQDIYSNWTHLIFSTEKNVIKCGNIDWSQVWMIRLVNHNKSCVGTFYFDDFAVWISAEAKKIIEEETGKTYGMKDTIVCGDLAVTLERWYPVYKVESYSGGKVITINYSRVDITIKNVGDKDVLLSFKPYKPILIDDNGKIYEYVNVKIRRSDGLVVEHPDQLKLGILYPGTSRTGAIFFYPVVTINTDKVRLIIYIDNKKFEFIWSRFRLG